MDDQKVKSSGGRQSVIHPNVQLGTGQTPPMGNKNTPSFYVKPPPSLPTAPSAAARSTTSRSPFFVSLELPQEPSMRAVPDAMPLLSRNHVDEFVKGIQSKFGATQKGKQPTPPRVSFLALLSYSTIRERLWMVIGLVFAGLAGLCLPAWLILLARALNVFSDIAFLIVNGAGEQAFALLRQQLNELVVAFAILGVISLVVGFVYVSIWTYTGQRQAVRIKEKFVKSSLRQDAEWFDLNNREELPTAIANSMVHIEAAIGRPVADLFANGVSAFGSLAVAFALNAYLALIMLGVVPVVAIVIMVISCFTRKQSRKGSQSFVAAGALATETISGIKTVASLCAEKWALAAYTKNIQTAQKHNILSGILTGVMTGITGLLFYAVYSMAFTVGTDQVSKAMQIPTLVGCIAGDLGIDIDAIVEGLTTVAEIFGDDAEQGTMESTLAPTPTPTQSDVNCDINGATVMCCIYGVILCATFFGLMAPGLSNINLGRQAAANIFATINRIPVIDADSDGGEELEKLQGNIKFHNVFFAYPSHPQRAIFQNFNLLIKAGSSVAFCGPSGSGKSTIAKLLLRFYCPQGGDVFVDGRPLGTLRLSWWRKQVGYVAQNPILFPGTIRYNIACGKDGATDAEVIEAAKAACAHEFILKLPAGYDTYYSGASIQLSGGQMQRLCIARAMIRKPSLLLLDEATSALDTNSERQVQDALAHIRQHQQVTTISVAHRLSTIVHSDQIAVISDGVVAELGTHKELLRLEGIYATLCESQGITTNTTFESTYTAATSRDDVEISTKKTVDIEEGAIALEDDKPAVDDVVEKTEEPYASKGRILALNTPEWGYLCVGIVGALVVGALSPVEGIITAKLIENFYTQDPNELMEKNTPLILGFLGLGAAALVGNILSGWGFSVSGYRLSARMRTLVFEAIVRRNIGWFDVPEHSVGELTARLEADAEAVAKITGWSLGYRIRVFSSLVAGVVIALSFSWQVGLVAICCIPVIMASSFVQKYCIVRQITYQEGLSPESIFENGLRGIDAVQSYGLQKDVGEDYSEALIPQTKKHVRMGVTAGLVYGLSQFATFGSFAIIFYVGVELLVAQEVTFVQFFTPILAVMFGALGISQVNADFNAQQDGLAAAYRIFQIIDEPLDRLDPFSTDGAQPEALVGAIEFKSCSFSYPTRPDQLIYYASEKSTGFSLSIDPKVSVAFVGKSGSGKSTALQILLRFYDFSDGDVLLDGLSIRDINIAWLRKQIGYVGQNPTLFTGTIRENIMLGNPKASEQDLINAAKAANAHDFIMKQSEGYDTEIGAGGSLLSGGQKQKIAIARAIAKPNLKILVLDEATAALDNESERIVQSALDNLQKTNPRTTLVVAHRLSTVKDCNKIAVLGNGCVRELGTHNELLEMRGLYRELWEKQGSNDE